MGVDSNVFNESIDEKSDTTAAFGPAANIWVRLGRARLSAHTDGQYLYFARYTNQRAWNTTDTARLELPLTRITPFITGAYLNTRERPGYEIDARARRVDRTVGLGTDIQLSSRTIVTISGARLRMAFDEDETFLGTDLAAALDRTTTSEQLAFRYALTPLTTVVVGAEGIQDRFAISDQRNADSIRVTSGFEFKPSALVSGTVMLGARHFNALDERTPDYDGFIAAVNARYSISRTRIEARYSRDLAFSFEQARPYYSLNDWSVSVTERIATSWDVVGRYGRQRMAYRTFENIIADDRADRGRTAGVGVGYVVGQTLRIGLDLNHATRVAPVITAHGYEGFRVGASISYGITQ